MGSISSILFDFKVCEPTARLMVLIIAPNAFTSFVSTRTKNSDKIHYNITPHQPSARALVRLFFRVKLSKRLSHCINRVARNCLFSIIPALGQYGDDDDDDYYFMYFLLPLHSHRGPRSGWASCIDVDAFGDHFCCFADFITHITARQTRFCRLANCNLVLHTRAHSFRPLHATRAHIAA